MKQPGLFVLPMDGMLAHHRKRSMKQIGVFQLPLDEMLVPPIVHCRITPSSFSPIAIYVPAQKGTLWSKG